MKRQRVVITGLGVVAANGIGRDRFANAIFSGHSGIRRVASANDTLPCHVEARIPSLETLALPQIRKKQAGKSMSRMSHFAVASSIMAITDAGADLEKVDPCRTGLCYGTTTGKPDFDEDVARFAEHGVAGLDATAWAEFSPHAPASHIAEELGLSGPIATNSAGCCTGLAVIDWGATHIASGRLHMAIVGAGDSLLSPLSVAAFAAGQLLTSQVDPQLASRPFDLHRDGLVPGEAAGALVLESLESAQARNAKIYAELLGNGCTVDSARAGDHPHSGRGLARAIETALHSAALRPEDLDCITSHGLSHPLFDRLETQGFKLALGAAAYNVPITSIKPMTGACFSGDGMLQTIASCLILEHGRIPQILHLETRDPACDLDYVTTIPRRARVRRILTNTRAFGGANSVLVLGRFTM
jgi:3-oxoacyl-[acyl-carrier-protein] synthase II